MRLIAPTRRQAWPQMCGRLSVRHSTSLMFDIKVLVQFLNLLFELFILRSEESNRGLNTLGISFRIFSRVLFLIKKKGSYLLLKIT